MHFLLIEDFQSRFGNEPVPLFVILPKLTCLEAPEVVVRVKTELCIVEGRTINDIACMDTKRATHVKEDNSSDKSLEAS